MIKLIIFDLGKVILDFSFFPVAEGLARSSNHELYKDPGNIADYLRLHGTDIAVKYESGKIRSEEFYNHIKESFCHPLIFRKDVTPYLFELIKRKVQTERFFYVII